MSKRNKERLEIAVMAGILFVFYLTIMPILHAMFWTVVFYFINDFIWNKLLKGI